MKEEYVSVKVQSQESRRYETWYCNVSNLNLSQLLALREELKNTDSVSSIDKIINALAVPSEFSANYSRDYKRETKEAKSRRRAKSIKGQYKHHSNKRR